jgi:pimeloyl-ACP methyl ester carboxylesterase
MSPPLRAAAAGAVIVLALAARADTVVLEGGKKLEGVVVSRNDDVVVLNPWNSRCPDMTWEIPEKNRIPRDKVKEVVIEDAPLVEARRRAAKRDLPAADLRDLAGFCEKHKLDDEAKWFARLAKGQELWELAQAGSEPPAPPDDLKGDPWCHPVLRQLEREYLGLKDPAALDAQWKLMVEKSTKRGRPYLERARRSAAQPKGRRDKVPLTIRSKEAPGGTYCIVVPASYDPLVPTPLVVGLHGGGRGGADAKLVNGSGEDAMPFYQELAEQWGWIVVCPTALAAPWADKANEPLLDGLLDEMRMLYNVDETRVYLTGHSMGGFGTWYWGPTRAEVWAAIAPCAGGGGPGGVDGLGLPTYIYHGSDDGIVGPDSDRSAAKALLGGEGKSKSRFDGVYTEVGNIGHGFPDWVREDIFRFFAGRAKDRGKKRAVAPVSSFLRKVEKAEVVAFGDPGAAPSADDAGDAKLADLIARLERGGGAAAEAADELAKRRDPATAKAVARVLRNRKANPDVRVAAARALGGIGGPEAVAALAAEAANEDYRIVDEVTTSLGRVGGATVLEPLLKCAKQMGAFFEASRMGNEFSFSEYEVRCQSFGRLADALAATGQGEAALAALEREVVQRVFTPKAAYTVPVDYRFTQIPPRARLNLVQRLRAAFVALRVPRAKDVLAAVKAAWAKEPAIVAECEGGAAEIP